MPARPPLTLRNRALGLLARREHSRVELRRKLAPKVGEGDDLESLLDDLVQRGWLSDQRFVEQAVRAKARRMGAVRIAHDLRASGVDETLIAAGVAAARSGEADSLKGVWMRRFGKAPEGAAEKARQVRFLQARGFSLEAILRLLRDPGA
jgi:regulatory protein